MHGYLSRNHVVADLLTFRFMKIFRLSLLLAIMLVACQSGEEAASPAGSPPKEIAFIENKICGKCHQKEFVVWTGTHHDLARQEANDQPVLGDNANGTVRRCQSDTGNHCL